MAVCRARMDQRRETWCSLPAPTPLHSCVRNDHPSPNWLAQTRQLHLHPPSVRTHQPNGQTPNKWCPYRQIGFQERHIPPTACHAALASPQPRANCNNPKPSGCVPPLITSVIFLSLGHVTDPEGRHVQRPTCGVPPLPLWHHGAPPIQEMDDATGRPTTPCPPPTTQVQLDAAPTHGRSVMTRIAVRS